MKEKDGCRRVTEEEERKISGGGEGKREKERKWSHVEVSDRVESTR